MLHRSPVSLFFLLLSLPPPLLHLPYPPSPFPLLHSPLLSGVQSLTGAWSLTICRLCHPKKTAQMLKPTLIVVYPSILSPHDHLGRSALNLLQFVYIFLGLSCQKAQLGSHSGSCLCSRARDSLQGCGREHNCEWSVSSSKEGISCWSRADLFGSFSH